MNQGLAPKWFVYVKLGAWFFGVAFVMAILSFLPADQYTVKGPLSALVAAAALLFKAVPTAHVKDSEKDFQVVVDHLLVMLSAAAACWAAWWWLLDDTNGNPWPYLWLIVGASVMLIVASIMYLCVSLLTKGTWDLLVRRIRRRPDISSMPTDLRIEVTPDTQQQQPVDRCMRVMVNDYRGRNPQHDLDAMIHAPGCSQVPDAPASWWIEYPSQAAAEAAFERPRVCRLCLPGRGSHVPR